jgi:hypothetical protein
VNSFAPWLKVNSVLTCLWSLVSLVSLCRLDWRWKTRRRDNLAGTAHTLSKGGWRCSVFRIINHRAEVLPDTSQGHSLHKVSRDSKVVHITTSMSEGLWSAEDRVQRHTQVVQGLRGIKPQAWPSCIISSMEILCNKTHKREDRC